MFSGIGRRAERRRLGDALPACAATTVCVVNGQAVTTWSRPIWSSSLTMRLRVHSTRAASSSATRRRSGSCPPSAIGAWRVMKWPMVIGTTARPSSATSVSLHDQPVGVRLGERQRLRRHLDVLLIGEDLERRRRARAADRRCSYSATALGVERGRRAARWSRTSCRPTGPSRRSRPGAACPRPRRRVARVRRNGDAAGRGVDQQIERQRHALRRRVHRQLGARGRREGPQRGDLLARNPARLEEVEVRDCSCWRMTSSLLALAMRSSRVSPGNARWWLGSSSGCCRRKK